MDRLARHIERVDPYDDVAVALVPRYRVLRETIRHAVRDPVVFRVGRIAIDCYVVGTDWDGNVVGLIYGGEAESRGRIVYAVPAERIAVFLSAAGISSILR